MSYEKQVEKSHYSFDRYFYRGRWMSYWYQTKELTSRRDITSVLDIGPGTTFMRDVLKIHRPDITYQTLDIADDLRPDMIGSVLDIPCEPNTYDVVTAFQVLEHIEFSDFDRALTEMKRVSKKYVFLSLPHFGPSLEVDIKIPLLPRVRFACKLPWPQTHTFAGQHYWEIGKRGYSAKSVRRSICTHFDILAEYVPFENQYHRFYILEKRI